MWKSQNNDSLLGALVWEQRTEECGLKVKVESLNENKTPNPEFKFLSTFWWLNFCRNINNRLQSNPQYLLTFYGHKSTGRLDFNISIPTCREILFRSCTKSCSFLLLATFHVSWCFDQSWIPPLTQRSKLSCMLTREDRFSEHRW